LLEDPSFQMSFAAAFAVVGLGLPARRWCLGWLRTALSSFGDTVRDGNLPPRIAEWRVRRRLWCELRGFPLWTVTAPWKAALFIAELAIISAAVHAVFIFFMIESFHRVSPLSPLLNIPAGVLAAAVTPLGLLLLVLPAPIAAVVAAVIKLLVGCLLAIVSAVLTIPGTTLRVPSLPIWLWLLYGATLAVFIAGVWKRFFAVSLASGLALLVLQGVMVFGERTPASPKAITLNFLDVGQGDSTLIEFPDGRKVLVDGGGAAAGRFLNLRDESTFSIGEDVVSPYLFSKGIRRLDAVVLTHAHHDHMDGLFDIIANFEVGEFWLGRNPMIPRYRQLMERLQEKQIPMRWVTSGQTIHEFEVLHPPPSWRVRNTAQNDDSVVLLLNAPHGTALLTGDIERRVHVPKPVDVLKVPHHGSRGVRLGVTAPVRVISVGANNPFGHPHASLLPALRTDQYGAITVTMEPEGPRVVTMLTKSCLSCTLAFLFTGH
jgi:competence protein ComEC